MTINERVKAAVSAFRGKSAESVAAELSAQQQLLMWLGIGAKNSSAQSEATYFACLKVLSEAIGKLPFHIQRHAPGQGISVCREHPYYRMLNSRPNRFMTASTFWSTMELCRNHYGNAYAWIDTRKPEEPQLWPMNPAEVEVWYDNGCRLADAPDVYYRYSTPNGVIVMGSEEVLHFKSHHTFNGLVGISVREQLATTIHGNVKAQEMLEKLYESGMTAKAVLHYTGGLNDANVTALMNGIKDFTAAKNSGNTTENIIPLPYGFTLTPLNIKLADSQFLEIKQYSALQIASAFGVKPYQVGDYTKSSYASAEAQQLSFLVDALLFNVKQYEEEVGYKLLDSTSARDGYHAKLNTGVLLRADQQTQINTLSAAVSNFLMTPNEARERLDLPHMEGGDRLLGNGASIPVQYTGMQYTNQQREEDKQWMKNAIIEALTASRA